MPAGEALIRLDDARQRAAVDQAQAAVDAALEFAVANGAELKKPAEKVFWGGYSGYFADPDGHLWEIAYNPGFSLNADGRMQLPPPAN